MQQFIAGCEFARNTAGAVLIYIFRWKVLSLNKYYIFNVSVYFPPEKMKICLWLDLDLVTLLDLVMFLDLWWELWYQW